MHKHVHGLDLLRAVAISLVVFQHGALFFVLVYAAPPILIRASAIGVPLFFVLSGFLIGTILLGQGDALRDARVTGKFWLRRALRTLPNYYLFLLGLTLLWFGYHRPGSPSPVPLLPRYLVFLQNFSSSPPEFFPESWSLSVEEWFYLVFPLALLLGLKLTRMPFRRLYLGLAVLLAVYPVVLRGLVLDPVDWSHGITKVVLYLPDAIAVGLLAAAWSQASPGAWIRARLPALGAGVVLLVALFLYMGLGDPDHSGMARTFLPLVVALGCALLLPWASTCPDLGGPLLNQGVRAIARWSYSLYLVNLTVSTTVLSHLQFHYGNAVGILSYVGVCLAVSAAIYHGFEAPILRWRDRHAVLGHGHP
jgi:peptidoglycan/LPS O-acetylase OafA/YrhL